MLLLTADLRFTRDLVVVAHHTGLHALQRVDFVVVGVRNVSTYVGKAGGGRQAGRHNGNKQSQTPLLRTFVLVRLEVVRSMVRTLVRTHSVRTRVRRTVRTVRTVRTYVRTRKSKS